MQPFIDKRLTRSYNHKDPQALRQIYLCYKDDLLGLALALVHDRAEAEDIIHEVFTQLIASFGQLCIDRSVKGYLLTATANTARNRIARRSRQATLEPEISARIDSSTRQPDQALIIDEESGLLINALAQLPYEQRETITLRHYSRMTLRQIAEMRHESVNTVQGRYRYGIQKLRSLLNGKL